MNPNKIVKGKRPEFYETPGIDLLMHMVMTLAQEHCAMRDRLDTVERLGNEGQPVTSSNIEAYLPDQTTLEDRERRRQKFLENLFSVLTQNAAQLSTNDTKERFDALIDELATES